MHLSRHLSILERHRQCSGTLIYLATKDSGKAQGQSILRNTGSCLDRKTSSFGKVDNRIVIDGIVKMGHHADYEAEYTPEAIRKRIESNHSHDYLKDSIYGAIDGAVTTFAVVSSVIGAGLGSGIEIILGLAKLLADGFSMATGNFVGTRAENQSQCKTRREEEVEIESSPTCEKEEIRQIYAAKGFEGETLKTIVKVITSNKKRWLDTMMQEEHGVSGNNPSALKSRYVDQHWNLSGAETLGIGTLAALVAFGIGVLLHPFTEGQQTLAFRNSSKCLFSFRI